jgi:hypothetical protein
MMKLTVKPQVPFEQVLSALAGTVQLFVQEPHFVMSLVRSISQPVEALLSQLPYPALHCARCVCVHARPRFRTYDYTL